MLYKIYRIQNEVRNIFNININIFEVKVKYSILHYSGKSKIILQYSRCSKIFWLRPPQSGLFQQMHLLHTES